MAFVEMQEAVPGEVAQAAEYNNVVNNVLDLDARVTTLVSVNNSQDAAISTLESRTTNGTTGNVALGNRVSALEAGKSARYYGTWTDINNATAGQTISNGSGGGASGVKITDISVASGSPVGCSFSNGTFTSPNAGVWAFNGSVQFQGNNTAIRALYFCQSSAASSPSGFKWGLWGVPSADSMATSAIMRLSANQPVSLYVAVWTTGGSVTIHRAGGITFSAIYLGA